MILLISSLTCYALYVHSDIPICKTFSFLGCYEERFWKALRNENIFNIHDYDMAKMQNFVSQISVKYTEKTDNTENTEN